MNKQIKLIDTDDTVVVTRGEGGWGRTERVKVGKYMVKKGSRLQLVSTQQSIQILHYELVGLKFI